MPAATLTPLEIISSSNTWMTSPVLDSNATYLALGKHSSGARGAVGEAVGAALVGAALLGAIVIATVGLAEAGFLVVGLEVIGDCDGFSVGLW